MGDLHEMEKSEEQLAEDRMESVDRQIHEPIPQGVIRTIVCPYCGMLNQRSYGKTLCCDLLRQAIVAVLMRDKVFGEMNAIDRMMN